MSTATGTKRPLLDEVPTQRKVRKGTQSCWECKRRKVRCTFANPEHTSCEPCMRRKTLCVSQEIPDPGRTSQVDDRISRVEEVLEKVLQQLPNRNDGDPNVGREQDEDHFARETDSFQRCPLAKSTSTTPAPRRHDRDCEASMASATENERTTRALMARYPSQSTLELISPLCSTAPSCLYGLPCAQVVSNATDRTVFHDSTRIPPTGSHPILLAKALLLLASYLQTLDRDAMNDLSRQGIDHHEIASNAVKTVRQHILPHKEMISSLDGVECLIIDSMYSNNEGSLREAWLTMRSAMSMAQFLGLDRKALRSSSERHGPLVRGESKEDAVWFHILSSDRYLSLMVGLPQGAPDSNFLFVPEALAPLRPLERLRRIHCLACSAIIKHRDKSCEDSRFIEEIDVLLGDAAAELEPQWWLVPDMAESQGHLRLMAQFTHFHALARLHLPYLLRYPELGDPDHHVIVTINASREILTRYMALRRSNITNYCRGIDFLMFVSAAILCIAYIKMAHCLQHTRQSGVSYLQHTRPSDRGLLERAVEAITNSSRPDGDEIESRIGTTLQELLQTEAKAFLGSTSTVSTFTEEETWELDGQSASDGETLRIAIPFVGIIEIQQDHDADPRLSGPHRLATALNSDLSIPNDQWTLEGVDVALFNDPLQDWDIGGFEA